MATPPPDWIADISLPLMELPARAALLRIHSAERSPLFFSPGPNGSPVGRFDSATGRFSVIYLALTFEGAFAETMLRNPARRLIASGEINGRSLALVAVARPLRLVRMHGAGLQLLGADNAVTTSPYEPCGLWADTLFDHPDAPDGVAYAPRHDPEQICIALFPRPDLAIETTCESMSLANLSAAVSAVLRRYGKGLVA